MSEAILFQDIITVSGQSSSVSVPQSEPNYANLGGNIQDLMGQVEIFAFSPTASPNPQILFETAPAKQESLFTSGAVMTFTANATGLLTPAVVHWAGSTGSSLPPMQWGRWRCTFSGTGTWSVTFRFWLTLNSFCR